MEDLVPELLLIDKPAGMTSFDVIRVLRRQMNIKKMGHAGTLDPLATGLMLIGVGPGTKKLTQYIKLDKEYEAEILVGERRATGDMEGEVVEEKSVDETFTDEQISSILTTLVGTSTLPVSAYSAIKKDGVAMYKRARKAEKTGEIITDLPMRDMTVYRVDYNGHENENNRCTVKATFKVASGTYIRSLAEEFGNRLGYPATLKSLRRTKVGEFDIKDAQKLKKI